MTLVEYNLHEKVMAALADTTAPNFGQWRGAMVILQVLKVFIFFHQSLSS